MKEDDSIRLPPYNCPVCGIEHDAVGNPVHPTTMPKPGQPCICINCSAVYTMENLKPRPFTPEEARRLQADKGYMAHLNMILGGIMALQISRSGRN